MTSIPISPIADVKHVIAISSCKGGVGKSTMAAGLAVELAARGFKVGLLDADIYGPSVPTLFQIPYHTIAVNENKHFIPVEKYGVKLLSFGFLLGDKAAVMRGPIVTRYIQQLLMATDWGALDYLLIDMPPGTGDIQLTITQSIRLSGAVIVTTPQTLSLVDVARGILMFEKVNVHILGMIENMAYFVCGTCDERHDVFGPSRAKELADRFGVPVLGEIPLHASLGATISEPAVHEAVKKATDQLIESVKAKGKHAQPRPEVAFDEKEIVLTWPDGSAWHIPNRDLRLASRDALSYDEMTGRRLFDPDKIPLDIHAKEVHLLGHYAVGVTWSDGHSAAIYPYAVIEGLKR